MPPRLLLSAARMTLAILPCLLMGAAGPAPTPGAGEEKGKPGLRILADPQVGFTPVTTVLTGALTGVAADDPNFCHAAVTWIRIDPGRAERDARRVREDQACIHAPEEVTVATSFTKVFELYRPGAYLFRLVVEGKDGTRVSSGLVTVQVLRVQ